MKIKELSLIITVGERRLCMIVALAMIYLAYLHTRAESYVLSVLCIIAGILFFIFNRVISIEYELTHPK